MMKRVEDLTILRTHWLNYKTYVIVLEGDTPIPEIQPGNFAEIQVGNSSKVFLRRPFSIFDANYQANTMSFFVKIVGEGTRIIGELRKGDKLNAIFPLGNSFSLASGKRVLIVAGGSGIAPFLLLGKQLKSADKKVTFLFGGRTSDDIVLTEEFSPFGRVEVTTEDGSIGHQGMVTDHPILMNDEFPYDQIYTCGPDPMMKAIARVARSKGIPCQVSLENTMACGFGACLCCITPTVRGNVCVCTEGPVFDINELKWQN
jgi:dihydroorotate dehydrogenase electron transfer subunit